MFLCKKLLLIHKPILKFLSVEANVYSCNRCKGDSSGYDDDDDDVYNFKLCRLS